MNLPNPVKLSPWVAIALMVMVGIGYFVFLIASWQQYQHDRTARENKFNELLDSIPRKPSGPMDIPKAV